MYRVQLREERNGTHQRSARHWSWDFWSFHSPDWWRQHWAKTGKVGVRYLDDIYFHLVQPVPSIQSDVVQRLTLAKLPLLEYAPPELHVGGFGSLEALLSEGIVAGALVDGQLVAIAHTSARSERHGDIGVATLEAWRSHGFATAAAALVARDLQAAGQIPVWSAVILLALISIAVAVRRTVTILFSMACWRMRFARP